MTSYNFDEGLMNGANIRVHGTQCNEETALIQQNVSLFVEVMDSLKTDDDVRQNVLLKEIYMGQFKGMQAKLTLLINGYQDEEEILSSLLDLHDWMEGVLAQYLRRVGDPSNTLKPRTAEEGKTQHTNDSARTTTTTSSSDDYATGGTHTHSSSEGASGDSDVVEEYVQDPLRHHHDKGKGKDREKMREQEEGLAAATIVISDQGITLHDIHIPQPPKVRVGFKEVEGPGECPICCEDSIPASELFIFEKCDHQYCRECLQGYVATRVEEGKVLDLSCPFPGCKTPVEYHQVRCVVTADLFNKYEEFTFIASLNADPSVRWCPKAGCGNAIIGDPENPKCECTSPSCRYEFCFLCSEPWHADATCEQYQQWKVDNGLIDTKFTHWAKKNTKKCPQCKTMIEKIAGCNHMTCSSCKFEFCWLCGGKYSSNHFDVFNVLGCPGMQSGSKQFGVIRRVGMRALIGTGLVLGGIIGTALAIPAAVVAGPIYGGYKLHQQRKRNSRRRRHYHW